MYIYVNLFDKNQHSYLINIHVNLSYVFTIDSNFRRSEFISIKPNISGFPDYSPKYIQTDATVFDTSGISVCIS